MACEIAPASVGSLAYRQLRTAFVRFESLYPEAERGEDPEAIHQARVNARRIRVALGAYAAMLPGSLVERAADLKWVSRALGSVRDLDVHIKSMPEFTTEFQAVRSRRLLQLRAELGSTRFLLLLRELRAGIAAEEFRDPALACTPALVAAPEIVGRSYHSLLKARRKARGWKDDDAIHTLRKRAKRFRYTLDGFATEYEGELGPEAEALIEALKDLQDVLGEFQDSIVAAELLREIETDGNRASASERVEEFADRRERSREELASAVRRLRKPWRRFESKMGTLRRSLWEG